MIKKDINKFFFLILYISKINAKKYTHWDKNIIEIKITISNRYLQNVNAIVLIIFNEFFYSDFSILGIQYFCVFFFLFFFFNDKANKISSI